ncbi:MAG: transglutaminase-like domain-containing protein [Candidatus Kariarchaeaceae archaeon]|jgi:transglutaminase-like putative cysteine protease
MVKERYAFRALHSGPQTFEVEYPLQVTKGAARDKHGKLKLQVKGQRLIIHIDRDITKGKVHAVELSLLIVPDIKQIGTIRVLNWGSLDLQSIKSSQTLFQVLGFGTRTTKGADTTYTDSLSSDIRTNLARFRAARVEMGDRQNVTVTLRIDINCSGGGRVRKIHTFGPTSSKRQKTRLLTTGVVIEEDENGSPRYIINDAVNPGQSKTVEIQWEVIIPKGFETTTQLGTMELLKRLTLESESYRRYLAEDTYWQTTHPSIRKIVGKVRSKPDIFDVHRLLFEFTNRHIDYTITNDRQTAVQALQSGRGDCSEYADLLVSLHRAAGIPSRVVEGMILEPEKRHNPEFHAWVEFLTRDGWLATDPTWGITLGVTSQHIEFNHQRQSRESSVYGMEYSGPAPQVTYEVSWQ